MRAAKYKFLSTLSLRRATARGARHHARGRFLSTLSLRRATEVSGDTWQRGSHFYPRSPCGERRRTGRCRIRTPKYFYPRSPCGERRYFRFSRLDSFRISIHALLAESDERNPNKRGQIQISIHALLAESDLAPEQNATQQRNFYPRSPCGERRALACSAGFAFLFLSTLSLRRATARRESRQQPAGISIHALLAESDPVNNGIALQHTKFLSTLSLRRATFLTFLPIRVVLFLSTLSLRRATIGTVCQLQRRTDFYPRSPCGERPPVREIIQWEGIFLSTLSLRRATKSSIEEVSKYVVISIHALLAESDGCRCPPRHWHGGFLSTLSLRRATTQGVFNLFANPDFYPRSPCGERRR